MIPYNAIYRLFGLWMLIGGVLSVLCCWAGVHLVGVDRASFRRGAVAGISCALVTAIPTLGLTILPVIGTIFGAIVGGLISFVALLFILRETVLRTAKVWVFHVYAELAALFITMEVFQSRMLDLSPP